MAGPSAGGLGGGGGGGHGVMRRSRMVERTLTGSAITKYHQINDIESQLYVSYDRIEETIAKVPPAEAHNFVLSMASTQPSEVDTITHGCVCGALTAPTRDEFHFFTNILNQTGSINAQLILTPMNYIVIERFWHLSEVVRENFFGLLVEMIVWRLPKVDVVYANVFKAFLELGPLTPRFSLLASLLNLTRPHLDMMLTELKDNTLVVTNVTTVCSHYLAEIRQCPPEVASVTRGTLIGWLETLMTKYFPVFRANAARTFLSTLLIHSKTPELASIWKSLITQPTAIHPTCLGIVDLIGRPGERWVDTNLLPQSYTKKFDFFIREDPDFTRKSMQFLIHNIQTFSPSGSLRSIIIKHILSMPSAAADPRANIVIALLNGCRTKTEGMDQYNYSDYQMCKMSLFFDWICGFPEGAVAPCCIPSTFRVLANAVNTSPALGNSLYEFVIWFAQNVYPPLQNIFTSNVSRCIIATSTNNGLFGNVPGTLDNSKIDRSLRDTFREVFHETAVFFRPRPQLTSPTTETPPGSDDTHLPPPPIPPPGFNGAVDGGPAQQSPSISGPLQIDLVLGPKAKSGTKKKGKRMATSKGLTSPSRALTSGIIPGWDGSLGDSIEPHISSLSDILKDILRTLETVVREGGDFSQATQSIDALFDNISATEELDDKEQEAIGDSLLVVFKKFLTSRKFFYEKCNDEKWSVKTIFTEHPFYHVFRQIFKREESSQVYYVVDAMYNKHPAIGFLLLFYVAASNVHDDENVSKDGMESTYTALCEISEKSVESALAADMEACAMEDYGLFCFLLPHVLQTYGKHAAGSASFIRCICTFCDSELVLHLAASYIQGTCSIFRRESFSQVVTASLTWTSYEQMFFWNLVKADGITLEWVAPCLAKFDFDKHPEACHHALAYIRSFGEPNTPMIKQFLSRPKRDLFTLYALKIFLDEDADVAKLITTVISITRTALKAGDITESTRSPQKGKTKPVALETILSHLDYLRERFLSQAQKLLKELSDIFATIKADPSCEDLVDNYSSLFNIVEILPGGRNLRRNRPKNFSEDDSPPKSHPKRKRIVEDSDEED